MLLPSPFLSTAAKSLFPWPNHFMIVSMIATRRACAYETARAARKGWCLRLESFDWICCCCQLHGRNEIGFWKKAVSEGNGEWDLVLLVSRRRP
jgi:hypothetical protein